MKSMILIGLLLLASNSYAQKIIPFNADLEDKLIEYIIKKFFDFIINSKYYFRHCFNKIYNFRCSRGSISHCYCPACFWNSFCNFNNL